MSSKKEEVPEGGIISSLLDKDYPIYVDEAKAIIIKFIEQSLKDLMNQSFRFSHLDSEREYYETARDFLYGYIAIDWGGQWYNITDWISLLRIDPDYFQDFIRKEEKKKEQEYLQKIGRKKRNEVRALFVSATRKTPFLWKKNLGGKLGEIGIKFYEHKQFPDEEVLDDICRRPDGWNEYRNVIRKIFDHNTGLISNSDFLILRWKSGDKLQNISHEISYAYSKLIPIYTISLAQTIKIPRNIFGMSNRIFSDVDSFLEFLKGKIGKKGL